MKLSSTLPALMFFVALCLSLTGCVGRPLKINSTTKVLTSGESISKGKKTPATVFTLEDNIVFYVFVNLDPLQEYGHHPVVWNWYNVDKLVSRGRHYAKFNSSPTELWSNRNAAALGVGHFKVETLVDNQIVGVTEFDIKQ